MNRYYYLKGMIELEKENFSEAISYFKKGLPQLSAISELNLIFTDSLAFTYYKSGDLNKAREEYKKITTLISSLLQEGDTFVKSFYMLGKIYEQQGQKSQAIENYEKFLDLWKNADPGIPEVEDAKKRLTGLK